MMVKPDEKKQLGRYRSSCEDNIKRYLREIESCVMDHTPKHIPVILIFIIRGFHFLSTPVNRGFTPHSAIKTLHFLTYFGE
jgi:hypothetical protein